jgi:DNA-binding transcriptional MerR regulator
LDLIKERLYYTIGEVAEILKVSPSAIRYWEKQFPELKPSKRTGSSKRKYVLSDIEVLFKIRTVLKDEGISIKKARDVISAYTTGLPFEVLKKMVCESNRPEVLLSGEKAEFVRKIINDMHNSLNKLK